MVIIANNLEFIDFTTNTLAIITAIWLPGERGRLMNRQARLPPCTRRDGCP